MKVLILNSTGFSDFGWVTGPATRQRLVDSLQRAKLEVFAAEVASTIELDDLLSGVAGDTLVWPNAYHVRGRVGDEAACLTDRLEARGVPTVGSPAAALQVMLHKDECQARLAAAGIPTPRFTVVRDRAPELLASAVEAADLGWPVVVKPTAAAGSLGISMAGDVGALAAQVGHVLDRYGSRVLVEEYLPSTDVTVGVLMTGSETVLLPTWYEVSGRGADSGILDRHDRLRPWGRGKQMRAVEEPGVLEQLETIAPWVVDELGIRDVTRIDGRLDDRGVLRIFDVNGMPALDYPDAVILRQVMTICSGTDALAALDQLACTLVANAAARYGIEAPDAVAAKVLSRQAIDRQPVAVA